MLGKDKTGLGEQQAFQIGLSSRKILVLKVSLEKVHRSDPVWFVWLDKLRLVHF